MQLLSRFSALTSIQKQQKVIYFEIYAHKDSLLTMRLLHLIATQFDYTFLKKICASFDQHRNEASGKLVLLQSFLNVVTQNLIYFTVLF